MRIDDSDVGRLVARAKKKYGSLLSEDELAQEARIVLWQATESNAGKWSWIWQRFNGAIIDLLRKNKLTGRNKSLTRADYDLDLVRTTDQEVEVDVRKLFAPLTPAQKEVATLIYVHGLTRSEVAKILGKSAFAVYFLDTSAIKRLSKVHGVNNG